MEIFYVIKQVSSKASASAHRIDLKVRVLVQTQHSKKNHMISAVQRHTGIVTFTEQNLCLVNINNAVICNKNYKSKINSYTK